MEKETIDVDETGAPLKYDPLDPSRNEIRVLTLLAHGDYEAPIRCILEIDTLGPSGVSSPYTALSYAWGSLERSHKIFVNDQVYLATLNLEVALRHIRNEESTVKLWIDAICINQDDSHERDQQVQLMRNIFSQAQETRVWLGPEADESDRALDLIDTFARLHVNNVNKADVTEPEPQDWRQSGTVTPWKDEADLVALQDLLLRSYWYRVWVIQEIAMSREVVICCGRRTLPWGSMVGAAEFIIPHSEIEQIIRDHVNRNPHLKRAVIQESIDYHILDGIWRVLSIQSVRNDVFSTGDQTEMPRDSLLFLLSNHRPTHASKGEDKYFALAGLVDEDPSITSRHSYRSNLKDTYTLAAESTTKYPKNGAKERQNGALDFLDFAGWPNSGQVEGLPSWVPDWSFTRDRAVPLLYWQIAGQRHQDLVLFDAPGIASPSTDTFLFVENKGRLVAHGFVFDTINGVGFSRWPHNEDARLQNAVLEETVVHDPRWQTSGESIAETIWRTLILDRRHRDGAKAPAEWGKLFYDRLLRPADGSAARTFHGEWYEQNAGFQINGISLAEIARQQQENMRDIQSSESATMEQEQMIGELSLAFNTGVSFRRLATTDRGHFCLAPSTARITDLVVILDNCHVPVVLRKESDHYVSIGTCYVHGFMLGEAAGLNLPSVNFEIH